MPAKASGRNSLLTIRMSEKQMAELQKIAFKHNTDVSKYVRKTLGLE